MAKLPLVQVRWCIERIELEHALSLRSLSFLCLAHSEADLEVKDWLEPSRVQEARKTCVPCTLGMSGEQNVQ